MDTHCLPTLNDIQKLVDNLFTSADHITLKPGTTRFWIDHLQDLIESLSNSYAVEKRILKNTVIQAKKIIDSNNLVMNITPNGTGWELSGRTFISAGDSEYGNPHLVLPPATSIEPAVAYQTVASSKLQAYTSYELTVFCLQAAELCIFASTNYINQLNDTVNISVSEPMPTSLEQVTTNAHYRTYRIKVGALQPYMKDGMVIGFVNQSSKLSKISHVSLTKKRPLTASEKQEIQNAEQPYIDEITQIITSLEDASKQLETFYHVSGQDIILKSHTTYTDLQQITMLQKEFSLIERIFFAPTVTFLEHQKSLVTSIFLRIFNALQKCNLVKNPLFLHKSLNWTVDGSVNFLGQNTNKPILNLLDGDTTVSQEICLPNHTAAHRVRVRSMGTGTISIMPPGDQDYMLFCDSSGFNIYTLDFYPHVPDIEPLISSEDPDFSIDWIEIQEMRLDAYGHYVPVEQTQIADTDTPCGCNCCS
ncbi:hypothetical protein [Thermoactinomyces sp. DSM 45892]|uniref:hypothetical protein n=1 Tax=Thermoactinomyces sp. DSM 45892 TaxID=1882753 RepID=UPI0008985777|nr:hypothetical protein [Thermoactinomyces sp. DSM 45892]SDY04185.1 hypothetical protein SAMN05444416_101312 [Thermoactinomyces sp. DSM 45892]